MRERRNQLRHPTYTKPELLATGPNQVWSWDLTKLRAREKWTYYSLYVLLDIYSRYVVGWMLAHRESGELAAQLVEEMCEKQGGCELPYRVGAPPLPGVSWSRSELGEST